MKYSFIFSTFLAASIATGVACTPQLINSITDKQIDGQKSTKEPSTPLSSNSQNIAFKASEKLAVLTGTIELPPVHPRNLFPRRMISTKHHEGHMVMNYTMEDMKQLPRHKAVKYDVRQPSNLKLSNYIKVYAVPIVEEKPSGFSIMQNVSLPDCPPPPKPGQPKPPLPDGGCLLPDGKAVGVSDKPDLRTPIPVTIAEPFSGNEPETESDNSAAEKDLKHLKSYGGVVNDDGSFSLAVPPSKHGYWIYAGGGKVHFKYRLLQPIKANKNYDHLNIDIKSTLIANAAYEIEDQALKMSNDDLANKLTTIDAEISTFKADLKTKIRPRNWRKRARDLANLNGFKIAQETEESPGFTGCSGTTETICYDSGDEAVYNLMTPSEFTSGGLVTLRASASDSDSSINLTGIRPSFTTVQASVYTQTPPAPANESPGSPIQDSGTLSFDGTNLTVSPTNGSSVLGGVFTSRSTNKWTGVDLQFSSGFRIRGSNVHSAGITVSTTDNTRKPFRVIAYNGTDPIHEYRWYTTTGSNFYGLTVPESQGPITSLRIEFRTTNSSQAVSSFKIEEIYLSNDYLADNIPSTASDSSLTLQNTMGWRATGVWTLDTTTTPTVNTSFLHPYFGTAAERGQGVSSQGNFWKASYGTANDGDYLASPAFTLGNMDVDNDDQTTASSGFEGIASGFADTGTFRTPIGWTSVDGTQSGSMTALNSPFCRLGVTSAGGTSTCANPGWPDFFATVVPGTGRVDNYSVATMGTHWGHVHWQAYIDVDDDATTTNDSGNTERYVEYSTDNGATWRIAHWFDDENHKGINGLWWKNHMHPFPDSDLRNQDFDGDGSSNGTDFNKDGANDYTAPVDNNNDRTTNSNDAKEWDTEWYMEWVDASRWTDSDGDGELDSPLEGVSMIYRFRFVGSSTPTEGSCNEHSDLGGSALSCSGWRIDDVALNNDDPEVGYFTDFNGFYDYNQP